jgi:hypothetical protein
MAIAFAKSVHKQTANSPNVMIYYPQDQKMCLNKVILPPPPPPNSQFLFQKWEKKSKKRRRNMRKYILFLGHQDGEIRHAPKK